MRNYCTLFDRGYMAKGLSLHASLMRHSSEPFRLFILCMDDETHRILYEMKLPNVELMTLPVFEKALSLQSVKASRSWQEFAWTCASSLLDYLLSRGDLDEVVYLDSDLYFFGDPKIVFEEIGSRSIGITPHRFPPDKKHMEKNGVYNVGWVSAKNTEVGKQCIRRWATLCRQWCFARNEPDRFADQKYLDFWERDYSAGEVCSIQNIGVNLAPWNISQYRIAEGPLADNRAVVFYHYHEFAEKDGVIKLTNYQLRPEDILHIYNPYLKAYAESKRRIAEVEKVLESRQKAMQEQPVG